MTVPIAGKTIVILTPVLNDWDSLALLLPAIDKAIAPLGVKGHVVIIDDGSFNFSGKEALAELSFSAITAVDEVVMGSNQGNQRALAIGIAYVSKNFQADYLVVMDSDLEDKPGDIPMLLQRCAEEGNSKIVFAERTKRSEGYSFRLFYHLYQWLYRILTGLPISIGNFSVIPWSLVRRLPYIGDLWNHFPASIMRARMPTTMVPTERGARLTGESHMNMVNLVVHAFSGFSVFADVVAVRVMLWTILIGLVLLGAMLVSVAIKLGTDLTIVGWTSQMIAFFTVMFIQVLTASVILLFLILSHRVHPPMLPIHDYSRFIFEVHHIYPAGASK